MNKDFTIQYDKAQRLIESSKNILITCHTRPDGDSCGCVSAFCYLLEKMGKKAFPLLLTPFAGWLGFLFNGLSPFIPSTKDAAKEIDGNFKDIDLIIIFDTNSRNQLPGFEKWLDATQIPVIVFDHHITNDGLGTVEIVNPEAASAGQVLYDFLKYCQIEITPAVAERLFVSLSSDTGWFRFGNRNRGDVYRMAAELIEKGAEPSDIYNRLFNQSTFQRARLTARMLQSIEAHYDDRVALQVIRQSDFEQTATKGRDTDGLIQEAQKISSVVVTILFIEQLDGKFKCSMRSKGGVNVRQIAQKFGGGGHDLAAGALFDIGLEDAKKAILLEVSNQLNNL